MHQEFVFQAASPAKGLDMKLHSSVFILALLVAGCSKDKSDSAFKPVNSGDAAMLNSERGTFETSEDPPIQANTHLAAGQLAESQEDYAGAIRQYEQALKTQPDMPAVYYRLGVLYSRLKQFPKAIDSWKTYIEQTNDSASGYSNLAFCYELAGNPNDAEQTYLKGIARDPQNQPCRVNYGLMLARQGKLNEATLQLQAVLPPADVMYNLGSVYEQKGRKEEAKAYYRKALELNPQLGDARTRLTALDSE